MTVVPECGVSAGELQYLVLEDGLSGLRVLEEIRALGFPGHKTVLNEYIAEIRPKGRRRPHLPIETPEGAEGQMDWSEYNVRLAEQEVTVYAFSYVLSFSRMRFLRFALDPALPTLLRLHKECFEELKGTLA